MAYVFGVMIAGSLAFSLISGNAEALSEGMMESAEGAVTLLISISGMLCVWSGFMRIAKDCGCRFYFGSDAHHPAHFAETALEHETWVRELKLTEADRFRPFG